MISFDHRLHIFHIFRKMELHILTVAQQILAIANEKDPVLVKLTGGAKDMEVRIVDSQIGPMVVTHLLVDTGDAMGANAVNTMAEAVAPKIEELTGGINIPGML